MQTTTKHPKKWIFLLVVYSLVTFCVCFSFQVLQQPIWNQYECGLENIEEIRFKFLENKTAF